MGKAKYAIRTPSIDKGKRFSSGLSNTDKPDNDNEHTIFSFEHMVHSHSVETCEREEMASLSLKLYKLSQLTWQEIKQNGRHALGLEKINQSAIKSGIPSVITPDVNLLAFRFSGKAPMVGFRKRRVFFIVWLDRNCTLYNHG